MTRLGWTILAVILLVVAAFASMVSFGPGRQRGVTQPKPATSPMPDADAPPVLAVPVSGYPRGAIRNSWGDARGSGTRAHHGTDLVAPAGARVVAAAEGTVEKLFQSELGGTTLYIRSPDGRWVYYYAHLAGYAPGIREGLRVAAGDLLGFVGDTGDAGPGNYHLHFSVQRMRGGERWWEGEEVNPYPLLARTAAAR
jgi:murein DD-endopeptidase MepM/ murein hydrolase activator NlpD